MDVLSPELASSLAAIWGSLAQSLGLGEQDQKDLAIACLAQPALMSCVPQPLLQQAQATLCASVSPAQANQVRTLEGHNLMYQYTKS